MSARPLTIAVVCSVFVCGIVLAVALYFMTRQGDLGVDDFAGGGLDGTAQESRLTPGEEITVRPLEVSPVEKEVLTVSVVTAATNEPIASARIRVTKIEDESRDGGEVHSKSRGADGKFRVELVPGSYNVYGIAIGFRTEVQKVQILPGEEQKELVLALTKGLSISGVVYDSRRQPVGGALLRAYKEIGSPDDDLIEKMIGLIGIQERTREIHAEAVSQSDGSYQIDGLEEIYYTVVAMADGHSPQNKENIRPTATRVDFSLKDGSLFSGTVVDSAGNPIPDASVAVYGEIDSQDIIKVVEVKSRGPLLTVNSNASGEFTISSLGAGIYNFYVTAPEQQPGRFPKEVINPGQNPHKTFTLKAGLTIGGTVVDEDGQTIVGAKVRPMRINAGRTHEPLFISFDDGSVLTDENGQFIFRSLESGKYNLLASHDDYASKQVRDVGIGTSTLTITLSSGGAIRGRVSRSDTNEPIAGALVLVTDLMDIKKRGTSDQSGEYVVRGLNSRKGKRYASVQADGYARISNYSVNVEDGQETLGVDFQLEPTAVVLGRVVNSSGQPVKNARVTAKRRPANAASDYPVPVGSSVTDASGQFSINLEGGEETWLAVMSTSYLETQSEPFNVQPGQYLEVEDLVLSLGGAVVGTVIDSQGLGVEDAVVSIRVEGETDFSFTKTATTDRRGRFKLQGLDAGVIDLQAKSTRFLDTMLEGVTVREGEVTSDVRIVVRRGNRLAGVVVDDTGRPIQDAQVILREFTEGVKEYRERTDGQGGFLFESLLAEDTVEIEVSHTDFSSYSNESVAVGQENLEVRLGKLGEITGTVFDAAGNVIRTFSVHPELQGGTSTLQSRISSRTFTSDEGRFHYQGVPDGSYDVVVSASGYSAATMSQMVVREGEVTDVGQVVLDVGGVIDGTVIDASTGQPLAEATVRVLGGTTRFRDGSTNRTKVVTDASGYFSFEGLRDNRKVTLRVEHPYYVRQDVAKIDPADALSSRNLRIILERGGEILGTVMNLNGKGLKGVTVYLAGIGDLRGRSEATKTARSSADGQFRFSGLIPGSYKVTARESGRQSQPFSELEVAAGDSQQVELVFEDQ